MSNILIIKTGLLGEDSKSNQLTNSFTEIRQIYHDNDNFTTRDLNEKSLPHLTQQEMSAWMSLDEQKTLEQQELASLSDELIQEFIEHDLIVIGMPMYNMGIPSTFKAYIDRIARAGKTFQYTENGPQGLVAGKRVIVLAARGGQYEGTPLDTQTGYIKTIYGLMGVTDITFIYAEGLNMGEEIANKSWQRALDSIKALYA
jgi:FMN-dependent NADH-azoreductase